MAKSTAVLSPNLGLHLDKSPLAIPEGALQDGENFRVTEGRLNNFNLGWDFFMEDPLDGPCNLIANFFLRGGTEKLIFGTPTDLYEYDPSGAGSALLLTPIYATGTVEVEGSAVSTAGGTNLGDATGGGNLAAAFDGTTSQAQAACATKAAATFAYVGKTLAAASKISKAIVYGSNNEGYVTGITPTVTLDLYGKNGAAPANSTDGTLLGTLSFTDTANENGGRTVTTANTTTWDHVWVRVSHNGAANVTGVAEIKLFSRTGTAVIGAGTNWDPEVGVGDKIYFGAATQRDHTAAWFTVLSRASDTSLTLTTAAPTVAAGTAYVVRQIFAGDVNDFWVHRTFVNADPDAADIWFASNGIDFMVKWNGTDDQVTLLSSLGITKVKNLVVFANQMIYLNFEQAGTALPTSMINSDLGQPADISSGISNQFNVVNSPHEINAAEVLGDLLVIYTKREITLAQFIGGDVVFAFRRAADGVGPLSGRAIANFSDYHTFLGADSKYIFDGSTLDNQDIQVWREAIRQHDPLRNEFIFHHFDEENGDLVWALPLTGDAGAGDDEQGPEKAYVQHYLEQVPSEAGVRARSSDPYSKREFPFLTTGYYTRQDGLTWDEISDTWDHLTFRWNDQFFAAAFPLNLAGDEDGYIYTLNTSQNKPDGSGLVSFVKFGRKALGDGRMRGLLTRVYPFVTQLTNPLIVAAYFSDHGGGPEERIETMSFDQNLVEGGHFTPVYRRGRFFALEFGTQGPNEPWELHGYDTDARPGGGR